MKLRDLWSPMSDLTQQQKDVSNSVVGGSLALLGVIMVAAMPLAAGASRIDNLTQNSKKLRSEADMAIQVYWLQCSSSKH